MSARRRTQGDEHPDTLDSINNLALLLQTQGKRAEALEMFRQELEVRPPQRAWRGPSLHAAVAAQLRGITS
jgi:hypothetical protein